MIVGFTGDLPGGAPTPLKPELPRPFFGSLGAACSIGADGAIIALKTAHVLLPARAMRPNIATR